MKLKLVPFLLLIIFYSIKRLFPAISFEIEIAILIIFLIASSIIVYFLYKKREIKKVNIVILILFSFLLVSIISTFYFLNED